MMASALLDEQGLQAILDEANYHGLDLTDVFESMSGFCEKVLWTLLEHPNVVEVAHRFCEADHLPTTYWVRR